MSMNSGGDDRRAAMPGTALQHNRHRLMLQAKKMK